MPEDESEKKPVVKFLILGLVEIGIAAGFAYGAGGKQFEPRFGAVWTTALIAFVINWIVFIPSKILDTEKYFDLTGSITYITCTIVSLAANLQGNSSDTRKIIVSACVMVWAVRLGSFLFWRVIRFKGDDRFIEIRKNPHRFFNVWTVQGLWVFSTAMPVFTLNGTVYTPAELGVQDYVGLAVWVIGFGIEVIADHQKTMFKTNPENQGKFIDVGLWRYSRHPNYFGEIMLWVGIFITCSSVFQRTQWVCVWSPMFVAFLLMFVSGVPMLETRSDEKWGLDPDYVKYKNTTSVLIPLPNCACIGTKVVHASERKISDDANPTAEEA